MIRYGGQVNTDLIANAVDAKMGEQGIDENTFPRDLYVFGVANTREAGIYLSPNIPNVQVLASFLEDQGLIVSIETVGNPAPEHWIALRLSVRRDIPMGTRIVLTTWLHLNNAITW